MFGSSVKHVEDDDDDDGNDWNDELTSDGEKSTNEEELLPAAFESH